MFTRNFRKKLSLKKNHVFCLGDCVKVVLCCGCVMSDMVFCRGCVVSDMVFCRSCVVSQNVDLPCYVVLE